MKLKKILFVFSILFLIHSFSYVFATGIEDFRENFNENIVFEKWDSGKTRVAQPHGIVFFDNFIYVTDMERGTIVVLDKDGEFQYQSSDRELFFY